MSQQLWEFTQTLLHALALIIGTHVATPSALGLTLLVATVVALVPLLDVLARALTRALTLAPHAPPPRRDEATFVSLLATGAPGTPGAAHPRAPSLGAAAVA